MTTHVERVLIAEDDQDDFDILKSAIEELSLSIIIDHAENGDVLIKILDEKIPDILFLDILMPCKDGKQCLKEIRSNKRFDLMPVIIYSSLNINNEVEFCFREGANLYTIKPTSYQQLILILEKIFSIEWKKSLYYPPLPEFVVNKAMHN